MEDDMDESAGASFMFRIHPIFAEAVRKKVDEINSRPESEYDLFLTDDYHPRSPTYCVEGKPEEVEEVERFVSKLTLH